MGLSSLARASRSDWDIFHLFVEEESERCMYVRYDANLIWKRILGNEITIGTTLLRHLYVSSGRLDLGWSSECRGTCQHACRLSENGTDKKRTYAQAKGPKHNCKIHSPDSAIFCGKCILAVSLGRIVAHVALLTLPEKCRRTGALS